MGSIRKTDSPTAPWEARWRDPQGRSRSKRFPRKRDAEEFLDSLKAALRSGTYVAPSAGRTTVGEWVKQWRTHQVHLKPSSVESQRSLLDACILPAWSTTRLDRVTRSGVQTWIADLSSRLSASRTRQAYHLFNSVLDAAAAASLIPRNPAQGIPLPRLPRDSSRRYLGHAELRALAAACGRYESLVLTLGYGGLRWGEVAELRVGDVDLGRGRLMVARAATSVAGKLVVGTPKAHKHRQVPLPGFVVDMIAQQVAGKAAGDLVWTSPRGSQLRNQNFRRETFDAAAESVGLAGLVPHELRHTAASLAIAAGASVKAVQSMLGHSSATLTLDRYGHLFGDELADVADRLGRASAEATEAGVGAVWGQAAVIDLASRRKAR